MIKKRNFFSDAHMKLDFKLDLDNIDTLFPIEFEGSQTKNKKVTFFITKYQNFCDAIL